MPEAVDPEPERGGGALAAAIIALVLVLGGSLLAWGSLDAALVSDDTAALGYVHAQGPAADLLQPQYDLRTVRFWRPLVTASLGLQEALSGPRPLPLRLFNLACHLASALLAAALARRLGAGSWGALVAGSLALTFPFQGGTVTWIVGRVDSQCLPLVLATGLFALDRRRLPAAVAAFLALATKEAGASAPLVAAALLWGRGDSVVAAARGALPAAVGTALGLGVRRMALGEWVGGYSAEARPAGGELLSGLASAGLASGATLVGLALVLALGLPVLREARRPVLGALFAGGACLAPLFPLLDAGALEAVHRRWLLAPDLFVGLAIACAAGALRRPAAAGPMTRAVSLAVALVAAGLVAERAVEARADVGRWTAAGQVATARELEVRSALADREPSPVPVLDALMPRINADGTAYVAQWGLADRYRAPFEPTSRPVWPWRPLFEAAQGDRRSVTTPHSGLRWAPGEAQLTVAPMVVELLDGGAPVDALQLDDRLLADVAPGTAQEIWLFGEFPAPRIEFVLFTELGFGTGVWATAPPTETVAPAPSDPLAIGRQRRVLPLRDVFLATNRHQMPLYHVLRQAADLGARSAYLEIRAVDDERGQVDRPIAASRWIRLEWGDALRRELLPL